jgi:hypothetical protein
MNKGRILLAVAVLGSAFAVSGATATCAVDFTESGADRFPAPAAIGYAPSWAGSAADSCDLLLVTHVGQEQCVTQTLVSAACEAGEYSLALPADGFRALRLVLRARAGVNVVGELVKDVSLSAASQASSEGYFDTTEEKLNRVVRSGERAQLVYSGAWTDGVASVMIDHVSHDGEVSTLFSQPTPAAGLYLFNPIGVKRYRHACRLHFLDSSGEDVCEPYIASYDGVLGIGLILSIK